MCIFFRRYDYSFKRENKKKKIKKKTTNIIRTPSCPSSLSLREVIYEVQHQEGWIVEINNKCHNLLGQGCQRGCYSRVADRVARVLSSCFSPVFFLLSLFFLLFFFTWLIRSAQAPEVSPNAASTLAKPWKPLIPPVGDAFYAYERLLEACRHVQRNRRRVDSRDRRPRRTPTEISKPRNRRDTPWIASPSWR